MRAFQENVFAAISDQTPQPQSVPTAISPNLYTQRYSTREKKVRLREFCWIILEGCASAFCEGRCLQQNQKLSQGQPCVRWLERGRPCVRWLERGRPCVRWPEGGRPWV